MQRTGEACDPGPARRRRRGVQLADSKKPMKKSTTKHKATRHKPRVASAQYHYKWCKLELDRNQGNLLRSLSAGLPLEPISSEQKPEIVPEDDTSSWPIILFTVILVIPIIWSRTISCVYLSCIPLLLVVATLGVSVAKRLLEAEDGPQPQPVADDDESFAEDEPDLETSTSIDAGKSSSSRSRTNHRQVWSFLSARHIILSPDHFTRAP